MNPRTWVILGVVLLALLVFGSAEYAAHRKGELDARIAIADSSARVHEAEAKAAAQRADAEHARAEAMKARGDSLDVIASAKRVTVVQRVAVYDTAKAHIDVSTLPDNVRIALEAADSLRAGAIAASAADAATIAAKNSTIAQLESSHATEQAAYASLQSANEQLHVEVSELKQERGPACGWRCGGVIGAGLALLGAHFVR